MIWKKISFVVAICLVFLIIGHVYAQDFQLKNLPDSSILGSMPTKNPQIQDKIGTFFNPVIIDFEDAEPPIFGPAVLTDQAAKAGITFNKPVVSDYSAPNWKGFAHSGTKVIEQVLNNDPFELKFTFGQRYVKVWVGYSSFVSKETTVVLSTYDESGNEIGKDSTTFSPTNNKYTPINTPLEVVSKNSDIYSATIYLTDAEGKVWISRSLAIDDIEFGQFISG